MKQHPELQNPPADNLPITDEDYALVINIWRREMGLKPIV